MSDPIDPGNTGNEGEQPPPPPSYPTPPGYPTPPQDPNSPPQYGQQRQYGAPQYGAPQYGAPQYGAPQYGQPPQYGNSPYGAQETNQLALWSMILGIASPLLCFCYVGFFTGIAAIVTGFIAKNQIKANQGRQKGDGMALAGIILGFISIALSVVAFILFFAIGSFGSFESY